MPYVLEGFHNASVIMTTSEWITESILTSSSYGHSLRTDINRLTLSDQNSSDAAAATNRSSATPAGAAAFRSRILVLSVTPDASTQYVPIMNCIFGAQKKVC